MKPTRKKIGKVFYNNQESSVWLDNFIARDIITIKIRDALNIPFDVVSYLNLHLVSSSNINSPIFIYKMMDIDEIKPKLQEISSHLKAEINYDKVDEFLHKIEKELIVERLS